MQALATRDEMKQEAARRMAALGMSKTVVDAFKDGYILQSEPPFGCCYCMPPDVEDEFQRQEKRHGFLIYHIIKSPVKKDLCGVDAWYTGLYVSPYRDEWGGDNADLMDGIAGAYVISADSERGPVRVRKTIAGGLERVG